MVSQFRNGKQTWYWECMHCHWKMGGKVFQNAKARIHLSGDVNLRTGIITVVCDKAPTKVMAEFSELERQKRKEKVLKMKSRKRAAELLQQNSPAKRGKSQQKLPFAKAIVSDEDVDSAWARVFFGLDMAAHKISHPLFRSAIAATKKSKIK